MPISNNLRVGEPDTKHDSPAHMAGVRQGNTPAKRDPGVTKVGGRLETNARRSTGVNPEARNPITPDAPNLPPA